jgi:hypothetical protein
VERFATVRGFIRLVCQVIDFGATADAVAVVNAMQALPKLIDAGEPVRVPKGTWTRGRSTSAWYPTPTEVGQLEGVVAVDVDAPIGRPSRRCERCGWPVGVPCAGVDSGG